MKDNLFGGIYNLHATLLVSILILYNILMNTTWIICEFINTIISEFYLNFKDFIICYLIRMLYCGNSKSTTGAHLSTDSPTFYTIYKEEDR